MSKFFYKDVKIIKYCQKCGVSFRPQKGTAHFNLCAVHRRPYAQEAYKKYQEKYKEKYKGKYKDLRYRTWKAWIEKNLERRRKLALESYHRNKDKHKSRKHRTTVRTQAD